MTMSMKGNGMSDGDKDGELRRTGRHGRTRRASLLGVAGRIAESEQTAGLDHPAQFRKPGKFWMKLVGVLTAAALGLTYAGSALADDFTAPDASSSTDSSVSSDSDTWAGQADGTLDTAPGDASDNAGTNDGSASTDTSGTQSDATTQPAVTPAEGCTDVQDWDTLADCVSTKTGVVTITKTIDVPAGETAFINSQITLTAYDGVDPAMTSNENGDTIFNVAPGASLTIGKDVNDVNFSYKGGKRFLVFLQGPKDSQNGGNLTVNNGTFSGINTTGSTDHDMGTLAYSAGGTVTINGGTFANNEATDGGVVYNTGTITINNGTFSSNKATNHGGVAYSEGKDVVINDGEFTQNNATRGGVLYNESGDVAVHNGTFSKNTSNLAAGVIMQNNENNQMTVAGGKFEDNAAGSSGGVIHSNGKLFVKGGEFSNNKTYGGDGQGGGAISQDKGTTTITGGTFTGNAQTFGNVKNGTTVECTNDNPGNCRKTAGGGAIRVDGGTLIIEGNVTFNQNYSRAYGWGMGGGAIYVQGTLYVRNDARGNKPKFDHNWSGIYDTQYVSVKDANGNVVKEQVPNGGAGGAIFLQDGGSVAYLMGGSFINNSSGYLGGAIYTEVGTTTYVAKAVAYGNIAGHFGGGLWLCPSGVGEASKGGNIALFDNSVDKTIDSNEENLKPADSHTVPANTTIDGTEAGDDFAIMNPRSKNHDDTSFMLMDTWFTDRTESAVTWYRDGIPLMDASGFADAYQQRTSDSRPSGQSLAVTKSGGRYNANDQKNNVKIEDNAYTDHVKNLTLGWNGEADGKQEEFHDRGVALKAVVKGDAAEQASRKSAAKSAAAVEISGNKARLSGGGFGTNGNVLFSTPLHGFVDQDRQQRHVQGTFWFPVGSVGDYFYFGPR